MKHAAWICLATALLMAAVTNTPIWWLTAAAGMAANVLVVGANGWKMPVRGRVAEGVRHCPMTPATRMKLLADVIPVGFAKASIGDFLITAGFMGAWIHRERLSYVAITTLTAFWIWTAGWVRGFRLTEKWERETIKDAFRKNLPILLLLLAVGNLLRVKSCMPGAVSASFEDLTPQFERTPAITAKIEKKTTRSLGKIAPPPMELLKRLRVETEKEKKKAADAEQWGQVVIVSNSQMKTWIAISPGAAIQTWGTEQATDKNERAGPFCRVTCAAHHGGRYDVETESELCKVGRIEKDVYEVPGWQAVSPTQEVRKPWPGPATIGFEEYKLYWSDIQSEAKVIHGSDPDAPGMKFPSFTNRAQTTPAPARPK